MTFDGFIGFATLSIMGTYLRKPSGQFCLGLIMAVSPITASAKRIDASNFIVNTRGRFW